MSTILPTFHLTIVHQALAQAMIALTIQVRAQAQALTMTQGLHLQALTVQTTIHRAQVTLGLITIHQAQELMVLTIARAAAYSYPKKRARIIGPFETS